MADPTARTHCVQATLKKLPNVSVQVLFEAEKGVAMGDNTIDRFSGRQTSPPLQEMEERQTAVEEVAAGCAEFS